MDPQNPSQMPPSAPPPYTPPPAGAAVDPKVRNLAIALFVLAAILMVGVFTSSWTSKSQGKASIGTGLTGMEVSMGSRSESKSWGDIKEAPGDFQLWGYLGLLGGLASVAGAVAIGVFGITNKPNKVPLQIFQIVLAVTGGAMLIFLIRLMTHKELKELSVSYSGILAIGSVAGIFVVSKMLNDLRARA